jgi:hypothetical protein
MPLQVEILHPSYAFGTYDWMSINLWNGSVTEERVEQVIDACRVRCRMWPEGGGFLLVIGPSTGMPSSEVRQKMSAAFGEMAQYIHSAAIVIRGSGFLAATARSIMSLVFLATRKRIKMKVFSDTEAAVKWQVENHAADKRLDLGDYYRAVLELVDKFRNMRREGPVSGAPATIYPGANDDKR